MDATVAVILAGALGLALGVGAAVAVLRVRREPPAPPAAPAPPVPAPSEAAVRTGLGDGATDVLDALRGATLVVASDDRVLRASPMAHLLGLVRGDRVAVDDLATAVRAVRARGDHRAMELEVDRGRSGGGVRTVVAQVVPLAEDLVLVTGDDATESRRLERGAPGLRRQRRATS